MQPLLFDNKVSFVEHAFIYLNKKNLIKPFNLKRISQLPKLCSFQILIKENISNFLCVLIIKVVSRLARFLATVLKLFQSHQKKSSPLKIQTVS